MTVKEYIKGRFAKFGLLELSEADLSLICRENNLNPNSEDTEYEVRVLEVAITKYIPELLLCVDSISESGFSISKANAIQAITTFYNSKCVQYGLRNDLNPKTTFTRYR